MKRTRILLVDDHRMILEGLSMLISANDDFEVSGTALNANEALRFMELNEIDMVIADCLMPDFSGVDLCLQTRQRFPPVKTIMLTMAEEKAQYRNAVLAGVEGYVLKTTDSEELYYAIKTVMTGKKYFCSKVIMELAQEVDIQTEITPKTSLSKISRRELEVLRLIAQEFSTIQIADKLFISQPTVESHRRNLIQKLGVKGTVGLALYALRHHII
jgi:DNA-binding NarL/FixJ family response regulator